MVAGGLLASLCKRFGLFCPDGPRRYADALKRVFSVNLSPLIVAHVLDPRTKGLLFGRHRVPTVLLA